MYSGSGPRTAALTAWLLLACLPAQAASQTGRTVVDETGRTVPLPERLERVISLAPSVTEIFYALGLEDRLVGVTNQCDFPPAAREKARIGDVVSPSLETILALKPDLVIGTPIGNRRETVAALEQLGLSLYGINPRTVPEIFLSIRHVGELMGVPESGEALAARLEARLAALEGRLARSSHPRVLFVVWLEPLITAGGDTFLNDLLRRAGAESITADLSESWPRLSIETLIERNPDYLILPRTPSLEARFQALREGAAWQAVRAARAHRVVWLDEAVMRPGPRIVEAIEELARALHPDAFAPSEAARK